MLEQPDNKGFQMNGLKFRPGAGLEKYTIVLEQAKLIYILLHTQFTTCITVRNAINLSPHFSIPFLRISSEYFSI